MKKRRKDELLRAVREKIKKEKVAPEPVTVHLSFQFPAFYGAGAGGGRGGERERGGVAAFLSHVRRVDFFVGEPRCPGAPDDWRRHNVKHQTTIREIEFVVSKPW